VLLNFIESLGPILPRDRCLQSVIGIKGNLGNLKAPIMKDRPHSHRLGSGPLLALGSAFLFGASTPIAKLLLGVTDPLLLAGLLYLGSGIDLALATVAGRSLGVVRPEAPLHARATYPGLARSYRLAAFSARPRSCPVSPSPPPRAAPSCSTPRVLPQWQ